MGIRRALLLPTGNANRVFADATTTRRGIHGSDLSTGPCLPARQPDGPQHRISASCLVRHARLANVRVPHARGTPIGRGALHACRAGLPGSCNCPAGTRHDTRCEGHALPTALRSAASLRPSLRTPRCGSPSGDPLQHTSHIQVLVQGTSEGFEPSTDGLLVRGSTQLS